MASAELVSGRVLAALNGPVRMRTPYRSPSLSLDMDADRAGWGVQSQAILATVSLQ